MGIWNRETDPCQIVCNYLMEAHYDKFFYVGKQKFFCKKTVEVHLYDKVWYKYYKDIVVMYIPFKLQGNQIKLKIASQHTINIYS